MSPQTALSQRVQYGVSDGVNGSNYMKRCNELYKDKLYTRRNNENKTRARERKNNSQK